MADDFQWAKDLVDENAVVLHLPTQIVGRAHRYYDGEGEVYESRYNKKPVAAPVLELDSGNAYLAEPSSFIRLSDREADFYLHVHSKLGSIQSEFASESARRGLGPATSMMLVSIALKQQGGDIEAARKRMISGNGAVR